jgi:hypothetical protein
MEKIHLRVDITSFPFLTLTNRPLDMIRATSILIHINFLTALFIECLYFTLTSSVAGSEPGLQGVAIFWWRRSRKRDAAPATALALTLMYNIDRLLKKMSKM